MRKTQTLRGRGAAGAWVLVALLACALAAGAAAQSGRRRPPQQSPTPQPSPEATPGGESESESRPRGMEGRDTTALASFVVMEDDAQAAFGADNMMREDVVESFAARLRRAPSVSVTGGGRGSRSDARRRAQGERTAVVVLISLEDEYGPGGPPRGPDQQRNRSMVIRVTGYEPKTGAIKYNDTVYQRAVRQTATIGGIGIPIPTRTISRYPSQLELRQAAHDAADRLLSRFQIVPPPDQP